MTLHPLINKSSTHYDTQDKPAIQLLEEQLSVAAMAGFVEGNIFKYKHRQDHKGQRESDNKKIDTYENYFNIIKMLLHKGYKSQTVTWALKCEEISYEYK